MTCLLCNSETKRILEKDGVHYDRCRVCDLTSKVSRMELTEENELKRCWLILFQWVGKIALEENQNESTDRR